MMFISTDAYLGRIMDTLEKVVAPEIESDHVRGQVFAVISLIQQLSGWIEYRHDFIEQEIEWGTEVVKNMVQVAREAQVDAPKELIAFLDELSKGGGGSGLTLRNKVNETLCVAIDFLHDNRSAIGSYAEIDRRVRDHLFRIAGRDLALMKPPMIEKISRPRG